MTPENLVSPSIRERVSVAPPAAWIVPHGEPVPAPAALFPGTNPILIFDGQHHAERNESYERTAHRLDTTHAVQNAAQWRRSFDPDAQHLIIHALTVWRHGTATEHARPDAVRLLASLGWRQFGREGAPLLLEPLYIRSPDARKPARPVALPLPTAESNES